MISNISNGNGTFSADVELSLYVGECRFELGHLGPGFALFGVPQSIDASEGELETIVDNKTTRWKVKFTSPITSQSRRFTFESIQE